MYPVVGEDGGHQAAETDGGDDGRQTAQTMVSATVGEAVGLVLVVLSVEV